MARPDLQTRDGLPYVGKTVPVVLSNGDLAVPDGHDHDTFDFYGAFIGSKRHFVGRRDIVALND